MPTELQIKQLAFLNETCSHFNLSNRSTTDEYGCQYYPAHDETEGCAIGRKIADKDLCKKLDNNFKNEFKNPTTSVKHKEIFDLLPSELKELGQSFLQAIQGLHDTEHYWTLEGLSNDGKTRKEEIITKFDL